MTPSAQQQPAQHRPATVLTYLWAAVPLATLGMATWAVFLYAAIRRRSWWLGGASVAYAGLLSATLVGFTPNSGPLATNIGFFALIAMVAGGCAHALAIRRRVFGSEPADALDRLHDAEREAERRDHLREEARELVTRDPVLARELAIGRPDLRRDYDDGGLVDVNHASASVLAKLPGMTPKLAAKAAELRDIRGPFVSAEDLTLALGMPPDWVAPLTELTIYPG